MGTEIARENGGIIRNFIIDCMAEIYFISFLTIKLIDKMNNTNVTIANHNKSTSIEDISVPRVNPRIIFAVSVSGRNICAKIWTDLGKIVIGKKVPLNRNIGVMYRKKG